MTLVFHELTPDARQGLLAACLFASKGESGTLRTEVLCRLLREEGWGTG